MPKGAIAVLADEVRDLGPLRAEPSHGLVLVLRHQARVTDDVGGEDRRELVFGRHELEEPGAAEQVLEAGV